MPNFRVMEIDIDSVAWRDELFFNPPVIENGELILPTGPGWGVGGQRSLGARAPAEGALAQRSNLLESSHVTWGRLLRLRSQ